MPKLISSDTLFSSEYVEKLFLLWYNSGKPGYTVFYNVIPIDEFKDTKPGRSTLQTWIKERFVPRGLELDNQIREELGEKVVAEKVKMLSRHAEIGKELTDKALKYFKENKFATSQIALRALTEGIRIERESRGLPEAIEKMVNVTDEKLIKDVEKLLTKGQITTEPNNGKE